MKTHEALEMLGEQVIDSITGFMGVLTKLVHNGEGLVSYCVEPESGDSVWLYNSRVALAPGSSGSKFVGIVHPMVMSQKRVDRVTRKEGVVISEMFIAGGPVEVLFAHCALGSNKQPTEEWVSPGRLEEIE